MRADFQQYYGLDLERVLEAGEFGRAASLAAGLPAGARTVVAVEPRAAWDEHTSLLALIADKLSSLRYERAGGKGRKPRPVERPKGAAKVKRKLDVGMERRRDLLFGPRSGGDRG